MAKVKYYAVLLFFFEHELNELNEFIRNYDYHQDSKR